MTKYPLMKDFSFELQRIDNHVVNLCRLSLYQMTLVQTDLTALSQENCPRIIEMDQDLDQFNENIQRKILKLIMIQPPLMKELESLITMLRISGEIERIGDHMVNIAKSCMHLKLTAPCKAIVPVLSMLEHTIWMHQETLQLLEQYDADLAKQIIEEDEKVDELFHQFRLDFPEIVQRSEEDIDSLVQLFLISRYLERSADHLVNISRRATL